MSQAEPIRLHPLAGYGSIATSLSVVEQLRSNRQANAVLAAHTQAIKRWQCARFRATYADLLAHAQMEPAANFFLTELYSEHDFGRRDAQFARIAHTLERLFPKTVVSTATLLAQLHALSESLDAVMAHTSMALDQPVAQLSDADYRRIWHAAMLTLGFDDARQSQLDAVQQLGAQLQRHIRVPGLRLMLKMMRGPASAAGLQQLQQFLERGFDTFAQLDRAGLVDTFLDTIQSRETAWLADMAQL